MAGVGITIQARSIRFSNAIVNAVSDNSKGLLLTPSGLLDVFCLPQHIYRPITGNSRRGSGKINAIHNRGIAESAPRIPESRAGLRPSSETAARGFEQVLNRTVLVVNLSMNLCPILS